MYPQLKLSKVLCSFTFIMLISLFTGIICVWNTFCSLLPPSSPAGGNYLAFDGKDDYAFLDFDKVNVLIKKGTSKFTVEALTNHIQPKNFVTHLFMDMILLE